VSEKNRPDDNTLAGWVKQSFWLDLAYDEEDWDLAKRQLKGALVDILERCTGVEEPTRLLPDLLVPLEGHDSTNADDLAAGPKRWFDYFLQTKAVRVRCCLLYDELVLRYSNQADREASESPDHSTLVTVKRNRDTILNMTAWRCSAAICKLLGSYRDTDDTRPRESWATLLALYHSELCASATPAVYFGHAQRRFDVVLDEAVGYGVFEWIARHNVARAHNHLRNHLEAVRPLDRDVDEFPGSGLGRDLGDLGRGLLFRLLYLPAIRTLAQALEDQGRHAERRHYLDRGVRKAREVEDAGYWQEILQLDLALANIPRRSGHVAGDRPPRQLQNRPRLVHRWRSARAAGASEIPRDLEMGLLRWHVADTRSLCRSLQGMAERLEQRARRGENDALDMLCEARKWLQDLSSGGDATLRALSGDRSYAAEKEDDGEELRDRDLPVLWSTSAALRAALRNATKETERDQGLTEWLANLQGLLDRTEFCQFRSEAEAARVVAHPGERRPCPRRGCSCWRPGCNDRCCYDVLDVNRRAPVGDSLDYRLSTMASQQARFLDFLEHRTGCPKSFRQGEPPQWTPRFELISLRRWNSFSPNLGSRAAASVGGGYLVRVWVQCLTGQRRCIGIAVDPGYNFLENLFNEGFTIPDLDLVVVTHAHPDHTENLTNLLTLLRERKKRLPAETTHRILLAMTEGVFERLRSSLRAEKDFVADIAVLKAKGRRGSDASEHALALRLDDQDRQCTMELVQDGRRDEYAATVAATRSLHDDGSDHDSMGVTITRWSPGDGDSVSLGILSDSRYHEALYEDHKKCNVLVAHLGAVLEQKVYRDYHRQDAEKRGEMRSRLLRRDDGENSWPRKLLRDKNHLYLPGTTRLICDLRRHVEGTFPLMVLSEFGEELRAGLRVDLARRLSKRLPPKGGKPLPVLPADVGLRIDVENRTIFCCVCHRYVEFGRIEAMTALPDEEALAYVCEDCRELRKAELPRLLEDWCRTARPVVPLEEEHDNTNDS